MKKITSLLLALVMTLAVSAGAFASTADTAGPPDFNVSTLILPASLSVYQGEPLELKAITTYTSSGKEDQRLRFVSDSWAGTNNSIPAEETEAEVSAEPAADSSKRTQVFTANASVNVSDEPGEYIVRVIYSITLQHDLSGIRTFKTVTTSACFPVDVLEGKADAQLTTEEQAAFDAQAVIDAQAATGTQVNAEALTAEGQLNYGQIVSVWAHWKSAKANENILSGGAGVFRSLSWYKTQLDGKTFTSEQAVYDFLDSIYNPLNLNVVDEAPKPVVENPDNNTVVPIADKDNPSDINANPDQDKDNPSINPVKP